jgi:hypothetical protein
MLLQVINYVVAAVCGVVYTVAEPAYAIVHRDHHVVDETETAIIVSEIFH